jgi:hypothetical protein
MFDRNYIAFGEGGQLGEAFPTYFYPDTKKLAFASFFNHLAPH